MSQVRVAILILCKAYLIMLSLVLTLSLVALVMVTPHHKLLMLDQIVILSYWACSLFCEPECLIFVEPLSGFQVSEHFLQLCSAGVMKLKSNFISHRVLLLPLHFIRVIIVGMHEMVKPYK